MGETRGGVGRVRGGIEGDEEEEGVGEEGMSRCRFFEVTDED